MHKRRILLLAACVCLMAFLMPAYGEKAPQPTAAPTAAPVAVTNPDIALEAELGYSGAITYARDIPLTVTVENKGSHAIQGTIGMDVYRNSRFFDRYEYPISLAAGAKKKVVLPVNLKMKQDRYVIEFVKDGKVAASVIKTPDRIIKPESVLIGVLSADPQSLSYMNLDSLSSVFPDRYEAWQLVALDAESFPKSDSLMNSFMMLVVDGYDVSALSAAQLEVLERWLEGGGIAVVGGGAQAAVGYPYFSKYTGLSAGSLAEAEDITPALIRYFAFASDRPLNKPVLLNDVKTSDTPLVSGSRPLIFMHQAGSGLVYTTTFELGAKPLAGWSGMSGLWPRVLIKSASQQYANLYGRVTSSLYGGSYSTYLLQNVPIETSGNTLPVIIMLVAYLLLSGLGSYFLLKRLDKREWMWFTVPALAMLCVAGLYLIGRNLPFNKPAVASFTSIRMNPQGETLISSLAAVSGPESGEILVKAENGVQLTPIEEYVYYYDESITGVVPKQLKYRMVFGDEQAVGYPAGAPWSLRNMALSGEETSFGRVTGRVWMQEDGLHAEIRNDTPYTFTDGLLLTNLGYARVEELKPGATGTAVLLRPLEEDEGKTPVNSKSIYEIKIQDGMMIPQSIINPISVDFYPFVRAAIYPEEHAAGATQNNYLSTLSRDELNWRAFKESAIHQTINMNVTGQASWSGPFHFVAFHDEIGRTRMFLDGSEVEKHGHQAVVDVLLNYEPIGPTGMVYYPYGTLPAYPVKMNEDGSFAKPEERPMDPYTSYQINTRPIFCFQLPDTGKYSLTAASILAFTYDTVPVMQLYNHQAKVWEDQATMFVKLAQDKIQPYIGPVGRLYVRFLPGIGSRDYESIMAPAISLEGGLK